MEITNLSGVRVRLTPTDPENWLWNGNIDTFCKSVVTKLKFVQNWSEVTTEEKEALIAEWETENTPSAESAASRNVATE